MQRMHSSRQHCLPLMGLQLGIVRIPPFTLIVNNGPPWKIIEQTVQRDTEREREREREYERD